MRTDRILVALGLCALLGSCTTASSDDAVAGGAGGKADDIIDARSYEVLLTAPHCDLCMPQDKAHLRDNSAIVARILQLIKGAQDSIEIAQFTFSNRDIEAALRKAHDDGIEVRLAMNAAQGMGDTVSRRLADAGLDVKFVEGKHNGSFSGLQHAKYMLVDGSTLLMGSNNWSSTGTTINNENTIVVTSVAQDPLVAAFACHFKAAFRGAPDDAPACSNDEVVFSPSSAGFKMLRDQIRAAQTSVDVLMHHLVFNDLVKELAKKAEEGLRVRVVVNVADRGEIEGRQWDRFFAAGGQVRFKQTNGELFQIMHHKLAIVDDRVLLNGSGNWSGSAFFNNFEFYWRNEAPEVTAPFVAGFRRLWDWSLTADSLDNGRNAAEQDALLTRVAFGNLHAHYEALAGEQKLDDGKLEREVDGVMVTVADEVQDGDTARHAFEYARDEGGLDFMALSPHCKDDRPGDSADQANMTEQGYADLVATAARVTTDSGGTFVALPSMEWSTNSTGNHVNVLGSHAIAKVPRGAFDRLYQGFLPERASEGDTPLLMFNHPRTFRRHTESLDGSWDQVFGVNLLDVPKTGDRKVKFNDYGLDDFEPLASVRDSWLAGDAMPDEAVVTETLANVRDAASPFARLMEVTVGRGNEFADEGRRNPSLSETEEGAVERFDKVHVDWDYYLRNGFRLAPVASHDNHFANWGTGHSSRTAVIVEQLTEAGVLGALEQRAAYATEDDDLEVRLYAGHRVRAGRELATVDKEVILDVRLHDPDATGPLTVRVFVGTVGGSTVEPAMELALEVDQWHALTLPLPGPGEHFAYLEVEAPEADTRAWSAPVWLRKL